MSIAGHVSRAMLSRYSHVRMEAKRRALDEIATRQNAADKKRKAEVERRQQDALVSPSALLQSSPAVDVNYYLSAQTGAANALIVQKRPVLMS
jgi:Tfp pilus assembly major pilin PilA